MKNFDFISFDGEKINCYEWLPEGEPKGIVQIIHGLQEHALRYKPFAEFLADNGFIVLASDQRLHGLTAGKNISKTKIKDVFPVMVKDQMLIADMLIKKYNKPLIVFGHSYGSFETQSFIQKYNKLAGVIICGSAYMKRPDTLIGKLVSQATVHLKGGEADARKVEKTIVNLYNKSFKSGSWISASQENVDNYNNDCLCGVPLCANFYSSMFKNVRKLYSHNSIAKIDKDLPIFIVSGKDDPVGLMGKSTTKLYAFYLKHGLNVKMFLYEGMRHEILNEDDKQIVYDDLLEFINTCIKSNH